MRVKTDAGVGTPSSPALTAWAAALADVGAVIAAALAAKLLAVDVLGAAASPGEAFFRLGLVGGLLASLALSVLKAYEPAMLLRGASAIPRLLAGLAAAFGLMLFMLHELGALDAFPGPWLVAWIVLSAAAVIGVRVLARPLLRARLGQGLLGRRIALFGSPFAVAETAAKLTQPQSDFHVAATVTLDLDNATAEDRRAALRTLFDLGQTDRFDRIGIVLPLNEAGLVRDAMLTLSRLPVDVVLLPDGGTGALPVHGLDQLGGLAAVKLQAAPMSDHQLLLKAAFDRTAAAIALVLLSPVFLAIAVAIRRDSKGPVFFLQQRHGYNHRVFRICKFRTMSVLEDGARVQQATRDDARVTRVGRFLRRTSLDELPQLWNVLRGDMSLVGPRPHAIAHNDHYSQLWDEYALRHRVKPGITGLAQVNGLRGETSDPEEMRKRALMDVAYTQSWSFWGDIGILVRTVGIVLSQKQAY